MIDTLRSVSMPTTSYQNPDTFNFPGHASLDCSSLDVVGKSSGIPTEVSKLMTCHEVFFLLKSF